MNRKSLASILGLLMVASLGTVARADSAAQLEGSIVSVTPSCGGPCAGATATGYDLLVTTAGGQQYTLFFPGDAQLQAKGGTVSVSQLTANARIEFYIVDGMPAGVEVDLQAGRQDDGQGDDGAHHGRGNGDDDGPGDDGGHHGRGRGGDDGPGDDGGHHGRGQGNDDGPGDDGGHHGRGRDHGEDRG